MPLAKTGAGAWGVILPLDDTNLATNPSYERGNAGVVAIQSATLGTSSQYQQFGAWSLKVTPNSNGTSGAMLGTVTTGNGTTYSVSVFARVESGVPMRLAIGDNAGLNLTSGSVTFTGGGTWQWYSCAITEAAQGTRGVVIQKTSGNSVLPFYVDGLKISPWSDALDRQTTYFDGDFGGTWQGAAHASASFRTGQDRSGGTIIALADLGFHVKAAPGAGMPPIQNSFQSYAVIDGAQFQRSRAAQRGLTLVSEAVSGTTMQDFHITRQRVIDTFKSDLVTPQQPIRFLYVGGPGTMQLDAFYDSGLEEGNRDGPMAETMALKFVAADPYWYAPTQQGTTLAANLSLGSVNFMARRSPTGQWGTLGSNGTTVGYSFGGHIVTSLLANSAGTIFFGGLFGTVAGTLSPMLGMYYPSTNRFGTLTGGTIPHNAGGVYALAQNPNGTLFFGGLFTNIAGTNNNHIGQWAGAFGTLTGGTLSPASGGQVNALLFTPSGTLAVGGIFGTAGGTARTGNVTFWTGAYGTLGFGGVGTNVGETVNSLALGLDNQTLFIGGGFGNVGGSVGTSVGFFRNGVFGTMGALRFAGGLGLVNAMAIGANGVMYEGGLITQINAGTVNTVASWNGVQHQALGIGVAGLVRSIAIDPITGNVLVAGSIGQAGSIVTASNYAGWNGASWLLPDISVGTSIYALEYALDNSLYIAGDFSGLASCAAIGTAVNAGHAAVYPTLRLRNLSASGTARIYQLVNTTTGNGLYFNYTMQPGEQATLILQPGERSFQSSAFGNIFGKILPGSNLASFNLLPGTNYLSFFSDNTSLEASIFWQSRGWSSDGGTVY
jgi:hypothetical protein